MYDGNTTAPTAQTHAPHPPEDRTNRPDKSSRQPTKQLDAANVAIVRWLIAVLAAYITTLPNTADRPPTLLNAVVFVRRSSI